MPLAYPPRTFTVGQHRRGPRLRTGATERVAAAPCVGGGAGRRAVGVQLCGLSRKRDAPTPAVIVIHENRGLTDWVRSFTDQLAAAGYLAIAPDLLSGFDEEHQRTRDFASSDAARDALYQLDPAQITSDLRAVQAYLDGVPAANGTTVVMGFCWGGSQTFRYATMADDLAAAMVFYGSPPEEGFDAIQAPIYGFYGENDERINATIPATEERMQALGKTYAYEIYDGAGHAFMRRGAAPEGAAANREARAAAWERLERLLAEVE